MELENEFVWIDNTPAFMKPERRLYFAMLVDAWRDLNNPDMEIYNAAYAWLTDLTDKRITGLRSCCAICGFSASRMARAAREGARIPNQRLQMNGYFTKCTGDALVRSKRW